MLHLVKYPSLFLVGEKEVFNTAGKLTEFIVERDLFTREHILFVGYNCLTCLKFLKLSGREFIVIASRLTVDDTNGKTTL